MSKAAEEAEARANEIHQQVYGTEGDETTEQAQIDDSQGIPAEETHEEVPGVQTEKTSDNDVDFWKHKFETLQGMYNADIPKLQAHTAFLEGMLAEQHAKGQQEAGPVTAAQKVDMTAVDALKGDYQYVLDAIYAVVQSEGSRLKAEILYEVKQALNGIVGKVESVGAQTSETSNSLFYNRLEKLVSDWEELNKDRKFLAWLDEEDTLSGFRRYDLLTQARNEFNADKVAKFFNEYKRLAGITTQAKPGHSGRIIAPGRSTGSVNQNTTKGGDEPLTRDQIAQFYSDLKRGLYVGREGEMAKMEARIAAMAASYSRRG